jgi:hypothetical protein
MEGKDNDNVVTGEHQGNYLPKIKSAIASFQNDSSKKLILSS